MERLHQDDVRRMLRLLRHAYAATSVDEFANTVIAQLPSVIPSEITSYNEIDPVHGRSANWVAPARVATDEQNRAWEEHMAEHPVLRHYLETRDGRGLRISDFLSHRQFAQTGLYREHYVPLHCDQVMAMFLDVAAPQAIGIGLHRAGAEFDARERLIFGLIRPHLLQAHRNAVAFSAIKRRLDLLLSQLGHYVVSLDRRGRIRFATGDAVERIGRYVGHEREPGRLPPALEAWRLQQAQRVAASAEDAPRPIAPFVRDRPGSRLVVRYLVDDDGSLLLVEELPLAVLPERLRALGLTRRESQILALVTGGRTNAEVSAALGLAPRTVEKHLEHVYAKLGVANRAAAIAIAFGGQALRL